MPILIERLAAVSLVIFAERVLAAELGTQPASQPIISDIVGKGSRYHYAASECSKEVDIRL